MDSDDEPLPLYERLSDQAWDVKTQEVVQRSLQSPPTPPVQFEPWNEATYQAAAQAHQPPQTQSSSSQSPTRASSSSSPPPQPQLPAPRRSRAPLPQIPTAGSTLSRRDSKPMGARARVNESVARKEAERYMPTAPTWSATTSVSNGSHAVAVVSQSAYVIPSHTAPPPSHDIPLSPTMDSDAYVDDEEAPPPFAPTWTNANQALHEQFRAMNIQNSQPGPIAPVREEDEEQHQEAPYHPDPVPQVQHEAPAVGASYSAPAQQQHFAPPPHQPPQHDTPPHRYSLPATSRPTITQPPPQPAPQPHRAHASSFMNGPRLLPPPSLFNAQVLLSQKEDHGFVPAHPAAPNAFYNTAVSSTMKVGVRQPPKRPRTASAINTNFDSYGSSADSFVSSNSSYGGPTPSVYSGSGAASIRSASPTPTERSFSSQNNTQQQYSPNGYPASPNNYATNNYAPNNMISTPPSVGYPQYVKPPTTYQQSPHPPSIARQSTYYPQNQAQTPPSNPLNRYQPPANPQWGSAQQYQYQYQQPGPQNYYSTGTGR